MFKIKQYSFLLILGGRWTTSSRIIGEPFSSDIQPHVWKEKLVILASTSLGDLTQGHQPVLRPSLLQNRSVSYIQHPFGVHFRTLERQIYVYMITLVLTTTKNKKWRRVLKFFQKPLRDDVHICRIALIKYKMQLEETLILTSDKSYVHLYWLRSLLKARWVV